MPASGHSLCGVCGDFALLLGNTSVVVHDIDPINIFVRNAGSQIVVRWIDFVTWKKDHRNEPYCSDVLCQNATLLLQQNAWSTIGHCGAAAVAAANPSHKPLNCPDFGPPRRCCPRLHRPEAMSATAVCRRTRWRRRGQLVGASPAGPGGVESLGLAAKGGLMERAERMVLLGVALLSPAIFVPVLWLMLVLTTATALGRFRRVWQVAARPAPRPVAARGARVHRRPRRLSRSSRH